MKNGNINNMEQIQISCKSIGELMLSDFCPRCFWLSMHCDKLPYQIFPGIFSSIDLYSKKITNIYYEQHKLPPKWFKSFGNLYKPIKVPHHTKFYVIDNRTNIKLTGIPDEIFLMPDGSYFIIDYKTAKYTDTQEELLPLYEIQLNGYGYIAERVGFKPVKGLGLIYYEPQTDISLENIDSYTRLNGFSMDFSAYLHKIELNTNKIESLLKKVREIYDLPKAPKGNSDCDDCQSLEQLLLLCK